MGKNLYKQHGKGKVFKIWDKESETYLSGNGKSAWQSIHWIAQKLLDIAKWSQYGMNPADYEVHEFEMAFRKELSVEKIVNDEKSRRNNKNAAEKRMVELKPIIMQYFPGVSEFHVARRLYTSEMLKESIASRIEPLMKEYLECEKIVG